MTREELLDDLAYARTLAEEGRQAPLIGGGFLVLFGVLLTIAYTLHWAAASGAAGAGGRQMVGMIWLSFSVLAGLGVVVLRGRTRQLPGAMSVANRVDRHVWQGVALAILTVVAGTILRAITGGDATAPNAIMAVGFGLYGVALYSTAAISEQSWLRGFAFLAWLASGAMWFYLDTPWTYLLAAGASLLVLVIPGVAMIRREPRLTV